MIDKETIDRLTQLPIIRCLEYYNISYKEEGADYVCCCPVHNEKTPSFKVSKNKKGKNGGEQWRCFGSCQKGGSGAISFVAFVEGLEMRGDDYIASVKKTAQIANISLGEANVKSLQLAPKIEWVAPQDHYTFVKREKFTRYELEALGCKCIDIYEDYTDNRGITLKRAKTDEEGDPIYKYSFATKGNGFNARSIAKDFHLYAVDYYIAPVKKNKGQTSSLKFSSHEDYPIFVFMYDKESWGRIYQPFGEFRFITWPTNNHPALNDCLFGDTMLMRNFAGEDMKILCTQADEYTLEGIHPVTVTDDYGKPKSMSKFDDVILCSGGSDAINTFYHSRAHVCFMGSEGYILSKEAYSKIDRAAKNKYIMFDLDNTGKRCALNIAKKYLGFKIIFLPDELRSIRVSGGKYGKDAKDYFIYYQPEDKEMHINEHFRLLMNASRSLKFWERREKKDKDENEIVSYEIDSGSIFPFLNAMGIWTYVDPEDSKMKQSFISVIDEHKVDVIPPDLIQTKVNDIMIKYIKLSSHYDPRLENMIINSTRLRIDSLNKIPPIELNLDSWGPEFDYVFFQNKAVLITAKEIKTMDYTNIPYHVYTQNIRPFNFQMQKEHTFEIIVNPEWQKKRDMIDEARTDKSVSLLQINKWENELSEFGILNRFILKWNKPFKEQPHYIQILYNTGRMHWRKEERDIPLSEAEQKEHDAHFINKVAALGYLLFRYKDVSKPWALYAMEDTVEKEGRSNGGSFKSGLFKLQQNIRGYFEVDGRSFEPSRGAINYYGVKKRETSIIHVEDIEKGDIFYHFYNRITSGGSARNLHESENVFSYFYWPKMCLTSNYPINLSDKSTARRIWVMAMSDYYHTKSPSGDMQERTPYTEFGHNIMENPSEREANEFLNASLQFMQFYLSVKEKIEPPMKNVSRRVLIDKIKEEVVLFFDDYFRNPKHLNRAISCNEILFQLKDFVGYSESAKEKLNKKVLREKLEFYCQFEGLMFNPEGFLTTESDKIRKEKRMAVWVTKEDDRIVDGARTVIRKRVISTSQEPCWYIGEPEKPIKITPDDKNHDYDPLPADESKEQESQKEVEGNLPF